jgi:Right handed beta helix region
VWREPRRGRLLISGLAAACLWAATPVQALAADAYVDFDTGSDANPCTQGQPCKTITQGISQASTGATVFVDPDSYAEALVLGSGKSLERLDFGSPAEPGLPEIDGVASPAVTVNSAAGRIDSFTLRSATTAVILNAAATVQHNSFDSGDGDGVSVNGSAAGSSVIDDNDFVDATPTEDRFAVLVSAGEPQVSNNAMDGYQLGVFVTGGSNPTISGNKITGIHAGVHTGAGVDLLYSRATIVANTISTASSSGVGVLLSGTGATGQGATLRRNTISGTVVGVQAEDPGDLVTMNGDLIHDVGDTGVVAQDNPPLDSSDGNISATNVTVVNTGTVSGYANEATLTLDSSIVGAQSLGSNGSGGCVISFSRGPDMTPGGNGCQNFQTTADPVFANPGIGDYHLDPSSPLIDAGNPAAPGAGILDFDGGPRACDGDGDGVIRRDMGADEVRTPVSDDCKAPDTRVRGLKLNRLKRRARVRFSATEPGTHFKCKLDRRPFRPCSSPKTYRRLKRGHHTFQVKATDAFGNVDPTAAVRRFRVRRPPR